MPRYEYKLFEIETTWLGQSSSVPEDEPGAEGWDVVAPITEQSGKTTGLVLQRER
jgi:hypothetical protein